MFNSFQFLKWDILKMQPLKELNSYLWFWLVYTIFHLFSELVFKKQTLISIILATIHFLNQLGSWGLCGDWGLS